MKDTHWISIALILFVAVMALGILRGFSAVEDLFEETSSSASASVSEESEEESEIEEFVEDVYASGVAPEGETLYSFKTVDELSVLSDGTYLINTGEESTFTIRVGCSGYVDGSLATLTYLTVGVEAAEQVERVSASDFVITYKVSTKLGACAFAFEPCNGVTVRYVIVTE